MKRRASIDLVKQLKKHDETVFGISQELRLDLADLIIFGLKQRGWTQKVLSDKTGIAQSKITSYIHARENPTLETVAKFAHAFGIALRLLDLSVKSYKVENVEEVIFTDEVEVTPSFAYFSEPEAGFGRAIRRDDAFHATTVGADFSA